MLKGVVTFLSPDFPKDDKSFGKIKGDDGIEYIFYSSDIMYVPEILEVDRTRVCFKVHKKKDGRVAARNVIANGSYLDVGLASFQEGMSLKEASRIADCEMYRLRKNKYQSQSKVKECEQKEDSKQRNQVHNVEFDIV